MTILIMIATLGLVEIGAVAFLGHRFLPTWLAWGVDVAGIAAYAVALVGVGSVLWRRHVVTGEQARFVLGYLAEVTVPRTAVEDVRPLPALLASGSDRTGPLMTDDRLTLVAGTGVPRFEVTFARGVRARRLWHRANVTVVEVSSVDDGLMDVLRGRVAG